MDLGIETRVRYDDDGIPLPPQWMTDTVEAGLLTVVNFDSDYEIAVESVPKGAVVFLRDVAKSPGEAGRSVSFFLDTLPLDQLVSMMRNVVPEAKGDGLPDVFPAPSPALALGSFITFHLVRTDKGAVLYSRACDTRYGIRIVFETTDDVERFLVSIRAACAKVKDRDFEKIDVPVLTGVFAEKGVKNMEELVKKRTALGARKAIHPGEPKVNAFEGMVPPEVLARFDAEGRPIHKSVNWNRQAIVTVAVVAAIGVVVSTLLARLILG